MKQLFYLSAPWCQPCKTFSPVMEQVSKNISVRKINIDYEPDVVNRFGVSSVPTVILVENEREVRRFTGVKSYNEVMNFINNG